MQARHAYDSIAWAYDEYTASFNHDRWLDAIDHLAHCCGWDGKDVLDVACGAGNSFVPLLHRNYEIWACDISPELVNKARSRLANDRVTVSDMRSLPYQ